LEPQYEELIGSGATQQHQDTDKTGMAHFLLANDALRAVDNFNVEKRRRIELPGGAAYRLYLDRYCDSSLVRHEQVEAGNVPGKWSCDETPSPQLRSDEMLTNLPR